VKIILHNGAECKEDQVEHSHKKAEIGYIIKNVIQGVSIHSCKTGKDRERYILVSIRIPE
jgi:hypothetical protein